MLYVSNPFNSDVFGTPSILRNLTVLVAEVLPLSVSLHVIFLYAVVPELIVYVVLIPVSISFKVPVMTPVGITFNKPFFNCAFATSLVTNFTVGNPPSRLS